MQAAVPGCFVKRWWGRGPQKSPPETFVRGLAVPPCSTPVTMQKKDPKKLCAFWGFISVPVVGVEQTCFSIWAIPQYAVPDDMWFFTTDFAIPNFEFALPQKKCGLKVWSKLWEPELSDRGDCASFHWYNLAL